MRSRPFLMQEFFYEKEPFLFFQGGYPFCTRVLLKPRHLALCVSPDFGFEFGDHFFFRHLPLEMPREIAVFEAEFVHSFPRQAILAKVACFAEHAFFHSRQNSRANFGA